MRVASDQVMPSETDESVLPNSMTRRSTLPGRLLAVDLARVLAILFMVQGHTLDVLLDPIYRHGFVFDKWLFLRGLTAPTFFVLSGFSFMVATLRRWDSYLVPSSQLFRRLSRFLFFIVLGYSMHVPVRTLRDLKWLDAAGWQSWLQVDVLQCIGLTLAFLQLLVFLAKTPKRFAAIVTGAGATVAILAPLAWNMNWEGHLPFSVAAYFSGSTGSFFPLFPWSAYVFFGVALGYAYSRYSSHASGLCLTGAGFAFILVGVVLQHLPVTIYSNLDYWKASPNLFLTRIGCVCVLLSALHWITQRVKLPRKSIQSLAQESLTIYFVHICILYGSLWNQGLRHRIGATLPPLATMGWIWFLVLAMVLWGWTWSWFKRAEPRRSHMVRFAIMLAAAYSLS
jgi:uncharacterized membrane protein